MNLGKAIKEIREERDIQQGTLAEAIGLSQVGLSKIENGHTEPRMKTLNAIALHMDITLTYLYLKALDGEDLSEDKRPAFLGIKETILKHII